MESLNIILRLGMSSSQVFKAINYYLGIIMGIGDELDGAGVSYFVVGGLC